MKFQFLWSFEVSHFYTFLLFYTTDVDECAAGTDTCSSNSYCENKVDGFDCTCYPGYVKSGDNCVNVNECLGVNACNKTLGTCTDTDGAYK